MQDILELYHMSKVKHKKTGVVGLVTSVYRRLDAIPCMTVRAGERLFVSTPMHEWYISYPECKHTQDITHAKNFTVSGVDDLYFEEDDYECQE